MEFVFWVGDKKVTANLNIDYNGLHFKTKKKTLKLQWFKLEEIYLNNECRLNTLEGNKWIKFKYPIERDQAYKLIKQELKVLDLEHLIK